MTIPPHAASRQRPSADLLAQKLAACNLNQIFFPGYTVVRSCLRPYSRESHLEARDYGTRHLPKVRGVLH